MMFGRSKARAKARRNAKINLIGAMPDDKLAVLALHAEEWETCEIAQATIVYRWMKDNGYTIHGTKKTKDQ